MRLTLVNGVYTRITGNECCEPSHLKVFIDMFERKIIIRYL